MRGSRFAHAADGWEVRELRCPCGLPYFRKQGGVEGAAHGFLAFARANGIAYRDDDLMTACQCTEAIGGSAARSAVEPLAQAVRGKKLCNPWPAGEPPIETLRHDRADTIAI